MKNLSSQVTTFFKSEIFKDKRKRSKIFEKKKNLNLDKVLKKKLRNQY